MSCWGERGGGGMKQVENVARFDYLMFSTVTVVVWYCPEWLGATD